MKISDIKIYSIKEGKVVSERDQNTELQFLPIIQPDNFISCKRIKNHFLRYLLCCSKLLSAASCLV